MKPSSEISKLCESWWEKLTDSSRSEQHKYATQFLELLGWHGQSPVDQKLNPSTLTYVLRSDSQTSIAAHFLMPAALEPPSLLLERGLDFCPLTHRLVKSSCNLNIEYAFITDMYRSYLYDVHTEELLLYSDAPMEFNMVFNEIISKADVDRGALEEIRRQPRSYVARQLREWYLNWCEILVDESKQSKDTVFIAIDRLIVMRYIFIHDILKRPGIKFRKRYDEMVKVAFSNEHKGCGKMLTTLFHDIWLDLNADIFSPVPILDEILSKDRIASQLIKEFALLSNSKFSIATILESFNFGNASEKARVRMVPDINEECEVYLMKQTLSSIDNARIEVDITEEGYRSIFLWFDQLISLYNTLETQFDVEVFGADNDNETGDLFDWSKKDSKRPEAIRNKYHFVVEHGLVIYYHSPRQYRTARLMLYLHLISRYHQNRIRFTKFPEVGRALTKRPTFLKSDRKWIHSPAPDSSEDEWDSS